MTNFRYTKLELSLINQNSYRNIQWCVLSQCVQTMMCLFPGQILNFLVVSNTSQTQVVTPYSYTHKPSIYARFTSTDKIKIKDVFQVAHILTNNISYKAIKWQWWYREMGMMGEIHEVSMILHHEWLKYLVLSYFVRIRIYISQSSHLSFFKESRINIKT